MKLEEIEDMLSHFKICPKCNCREGFWLGLKNEHAYVQCKGCGGKFELSELYMVNEKPETPRRIKLFRR